MLLYPFIRVVTFTVLPGHVRRNIQLSIEAGGERTHEHFLLEELIRLAGKSERQKAALYLGQLLSAMSFGKYVYAPDQEKVGWLVEFLYLNGQKETADRICNEVTRNGHHFLKVVYNKVSNRF